MCSGTNKITLLAQHISHIVMGFCHIGIQTNGCFVRCYGFLELVPGFHYQTNVAVCSGKIRVNIQYTTVENQCFVGLSALKEKRAKGVLINCIIWLQHDGLLDKGQCLIKLP